MKQILATSADNVLIIFDFGILEDGMNFRPDNHELSGSIAQLLICGVRVCVITAAGYGLDAKQYENRLQGLLDSFVERNLTSEQIERFFVCGGECNYLFQCHLIDSNDTEKRSVLAPVPYELWQAEHLGGPRPYYWPQEEINQVLDIAEAVMRQFVSDFCLRAKILRKERAIGIYPGGIDMAALVPIGHGSKKIKREALDELVLQVMEALRSADPPIQIPFCVFNGGRDAWLDVGNKSVAVAALQKYFGIESKNCLHVGDQVSHEGKYSL